MNFQLIIRAKAAAKHLIASIALALCAAVLVFGLWYPSPYAELSGGRTLFLIIVFADVICGPLLTFVVFSTSKPKAELWRDLSIVVIVQLAALSFGLHTVWQARPLFFVHEIDRFKVIAAPVLDATAVNSLPEKLRPHWWLGPIVVATRAPVSADERQTVMFESIQGGRDFGERPNFYIPYEGSTAAKSAERAKPLASFLQKHPTQLTAAKKLADRKQADVAKWLYVPIISRVDWVAVINIDGQIQGYLKGDGF